MQTLFPETLTDFEQYDEKNPEIWDLFVRFAFREIGKGRRHYGAKTIFEEIRRHTKIETKDPKYKLNNSYTPYYARKFHRVYPQCDGFFELRRVRNGVR